MLAILPYVATMIGMCATSWPPDRTGRRRLFIAGPLVGFAARLFLSVRCQASGEREPFVAGRLTFTPPARCERRRHVSTRYIADAGRMRRAPIESTQDDRQSIGTAVMNDILLLA